MKNNETVLWIILGMAVLFVFSGGFGMMGFGSRGYGYSGMMSMMYGSYGSGMMFFGWIYSLLILAALILFIVWLVQQLQNPRRK